MAAIRCLAIPSDDVPRVWHIVADDIGRALEWAQGEMTVSDVRDAAERGQMLLLMFYRDGAYLAAVIAELADKPQKRICNVVAAGGRDMDAWLDTWWLHITRLAKEQGAAAIYVAGRAGWTRRLAPYGFKQAYTVLARDL